MQSRASAVWFGHVAVIYAVACVPLIIPWLSVLTSIDDRWVGGGHIQIPSVIGGLTMVPSALCLVLGVVALYIGIVCRRKWTIIEGSIAILISPIALAMHCLALGLLHVG